jgi:hypothetical protein
MKSPRSHPSFLVGIGLAFLTTIPPRPALQASVTLNASDAFVVSSSATGDLILAGDLSVSKGIDFGIAAANPSLAAAQINYFGGTENAAKFDLTDPFGTFLWRDHLVGVARNKMTLDGGNLLTLHKSDGTGVGIVLNPNTSQLHLSGTGSGIYLGGLPVFTIGSTGNLLFGNRLLSLSSTAPAYSSTTGALTIAGGLGVATDSYVNGIRIGRGGSNVASNTAYGASALKVNSTGYSNSAFGYSTLVSNKTGISNTAAGSYALLQNTTGSHNTSAGSFSLYSNTSGYSNTAAGYYALFGNTSGGYNSAAGCFALRGNTSGGYNTASGSMSLYCNSTGYSNTAAGYYALFGNTSGGYNTASGSQSLHSNSTGYYNTAAGYYSLRANTTGYYNTAAGAQSLYYNTTGGSNVAIGSNAGSYMANGSSALTTTNRSIYIGANSRGCSNLDQNSIVIGASAIGEGANTTVIGNSQTLKTHIFGEVSASRVMVGERQVVTQTSNNFMIQNGAILAMGESAQAIGSHSIAFGLNSKADSACAVALGSRNLSSGGLMTSVSADAWLENGVLFELGNGNPSPTDAVGPSNAITTLKCGQTTLTNKAWKSNAAHLASNPDPSTESSGEALIVEGHTRLKGKVIIEQPQGDISMGIYGP